MVCLELSKYNAGNQTANVIRQSVFWECVCVCEWMWTANLLQMKLAQGKLNSCSIFGFVIVLQKLFILAEYNRNLHKAAIWNVLVF